MRLVLLAGADRLAVYINQLYPDPWVQMGKRPKPHYSFAVSFSIAAFASLAT